MKLTKTISSTILKAYSVLTRNFVLRSQRCLHTLPNKSFLSCNSLQKPSFTISKKFTHNEDVNETEDIDITNGIDVYSELYQQPQSIKHILYPNSKDPLIKKLNDSASLRDVFEVIRQHQDELNAMHVTQTVLVLWDLQKMFYHVSLSNSTSHIDITQFNKLSEKYIKLFKSDSLFAKLKELLEDRQDEFNVEQISYILLYLNKIGIGPKEKIMSMLISKFQDKYKEGDSMASLARFMIAIYVKRDMSFYYNIQEFIPMIINAIDKCDTAEELYTITTCLATINPMITSDSLLRYKGKVTEVLNVLETSVHTEYKTIISVMNLLNLPHWREENVGIIIKCLSMLKNHLHLLSVNDLLVVNEIFSKIQEPGDILNEIQRCASRYLQQLEEEMCPQLDIRLKLISCVMYFAPPSQRPQFKKIIDTYIDYNLDGLSLLELHKILVFTKFPDDNICRKFWRKMTACLEDENFLDTHLLKVCQSYVTFNENIPGCRCEELERKITSILEHEMDSKLMGLAPSYFPTPASFLLIFSKNRETLNRVIAKIHEFAEYFNHIDCFNISNALLNAIGENELLTKRDIVDIRNSLDKCTNKNISDKQCSLNTTSLLLKSCIYRNSTDKVLLNRLFDQYKNKATLYSMLIKNMLYNLFIMNTLLPDTMNNLVDYFVRRKGDILGFNAERMVYLCYHLGYLPDRHEEFFQSVIDVILRDQERMSGLSFLQASLALCFYHTLPISFIRQIFNVEFLEKLDLELANCYFRDVYPSRVRYHMMQLNRAVCLDYPESNVPWFHQKYIEQNRKDYRHSERDYAIFKSIKECLTEIIKHEDWIEEDEITPYGYHIDFIVHLDANNNFTSKDNSRQKMAILILKSNYYTQGYKRLKGFYQLKIRHLEILGYKVRLVDAFAWRALIPFGEKISAMVNIIRCEEIYSELIRNLRKASK